MTRRYRKYFDLRDPMVKILTALLLFITIGTGFSGCRMERKKRIKVELDAAYNQNEVLQEGQLSPNAFTSLCVKAIEEKLSKDDRFEVLRTDTEVQNPSVETKAKKINDDKPAITLSIYAGYDPDKSVSGMIIYPDVPASEQNEETLKAAEIIQKEFTLEEWTPVLNYLYYKPFVEDQYQIQRTDISDLEAYEYETWGILEKTDVPVIVIEQIHLSSAADTERWASDAGYKEIADHYYEALKDYFGLEDIELDVQSE